MKVNFKELIKGILVICSYFILPSIIALPFIFLYKKHVSLFYLFSYLFTTLFYVFIYKKSLLEYLKDFKSNYKKILKTTAKYWLTGLIIMIISSLIIGLLNIPTPINQDENISLFKEIPYVYPVIAIIFAPIMEELVFRKNMNKFTDNIHLYSITTGLIFGIIHITSSIGSISDLPMLVHLIPYCSVGIAFGYAYKKTNNILGTICFHALHNLISIIEIIILL